MPVLLPNTNTEASVAVALAAMRIGLSGNAESQRRLFFNGVIAGNGADTTEDTLSDFGFTIPANTLINVGDTIRIIAGGSFAASTDNKSARIKFGNLTFPISGALVGAVKWTLECWITKTGTNTQSYTIIGNTVGTANNNGVTSGTGTITDTSSIAVSITGQNATNSVLNSVTCQYAAIDYMRGT